MSLSSTPVIIRVAMALPGAGAVRNASAKVRLESFCRALGDDLGTTVQSRAFADYSQLLTAVNEGTVDIAWLPPLLAARAAEAGSATPLALPLRGEQATYRSALFARASSPIGKIEDLRGARAAWVDPKSMAGYLAIRAWLVSRGLDPAEAFGAISFVGSHRAVTAAVMEGDADVGATYAHVDPMGAVQSGGWGDAQVRVLALTGPIPPDVLAGSSHLSPSVAARITSALVEHASDQLRGSALALFEADEFVSPDAEVLDSLLNLARHVGRE